MCQKFELRGNFSLGKEGEYPGLILFTWWKNNNAAVPQTN